MATETFTLNIYTARWTDCLNWECYDGELKVRSERGHTRSVGICPTCKGLGKIPTWTLMEQQKGARQVYADEKPWETYSDNGEVPGDICCQRATGRYCYEHDPTHWKQVPGGWILV